MTEDLGLSTSVRVADLLILTCAKSARPRHVSAAVLRLYTPGDTGVTISNPPVEFIFKSDVFSQRGGPLI